jgi:hypothetical protein
MTARKAVVKFATFVARGVQEAYSQTGGRSQGLLR